MISSPRELFVVGASDDALDRLHALGDTRAAVAFKRSGGGALRRGL